MLKALVVDDSSVVRKSLVRRLRQIGFQTDSAVHGHDAFLRAIRNAYDLVLMDIDMPMMNGLDASQCIRAAESFLDRHTPIVGMTAGGYTLDESLQSGMDDFVKKPFTTEELRRIALRFCSGYRPLPVHEQSDGTVQMFVARDYWEYGIADGA
jgi:CheY-like chemotaxis protein